LVTSQNVHEVPPLVPPISGAASRDEPVVGVPPLEPPLGAWVVCEADAPSLPTGADASTAAMVPSVAWPLDAASTSPSVGSSPGSPEPKPPALWGAHPAKNVISNMSVGRLMVRCSTTVASADHARDHNPFRRYFRGMKANRAHNAKRDAKEPAPAPRVPMQLDRGIRKTVELLRANGVETCESCEGSHGHAFREPTVVFYGTPDAGWRALSVCLAHGLPVLALRRSWPINYGEPSGPYWEITFKRRPG
jgi:hypothetical protein